MHRPGVKKLLRNLVKQWDRNMQILITTAGMDLLWTHTVQHLVDEILSIIQKMVCLVAILVQLKLMVPQQKACMHI